MNQVPTHYLFVLRLAETSHQPTATKDPNVVILFGWNYTFLSNFAGNLGPQQLRGAFSHPSSSTKSKEIN